MIGWGRARILAGIVTLAVACLAAPANAQFLVADDRYENFGGYAGGITLGGLANSTAGIVALTPDAPSGMGLNPNGVGNYLIGGYYDVRPRGTDAQVVNIQILNNNSNDASLPRCSINPARGDFDPVPFFEGTDGERCYNPYGGVVAKVRFRDSRRSCEVLDFNIVLSCGEVWTGRVENRGGTPFLVSNSPIVSTRTDLDPGLPPNGNGNVVTTQLFSQGQPFAIPAECDAPQEVTPPDITRGYFEVVGLSSIACEPDRINTDDTIPDLNVGAGTVSQTGNRWTWRNAPGNPLNTNFAPTHALSSQAFLVRTASGVSFSYNATALTRFQHPTIDDAFSPSLWFQANSPNLQQCSPFDINGNPILVNPDTVCINQANLALHKARLMGQYDTESITAGRNNLIVTLPTKHMNCQEELPNQPRVPPSVLPTVQNPFECGAQEQISCTIYDRLENFINVAAGGGGVISPFPPGGQCSLPREVTVIGIRAQTTGDEADFFLNPATLPLCQNPSTCAGWVELVLTGFPFGFDRQILLPPGVHSLDGIFVGGYIGLPALGLVQQEFTNGLAGGAYGSIVEATYDDPIILFAGS